MPRSLLSALFLVLFKTLLEGCARGVAAADGNVTNPFRKLKEIEIKPNAHIVQRTRKTMKDLKMKAIMQRQQQQQRHPRKRTLQEQPRQQKSQRRSRQLSFYSTGGESGTVEDDNIGGVGGGDEHIYTTGGGSGAGEDQGGDAVREGGAKGGGEEYPYDSEDLPYIVSQEKAGLRHYSHGKHTATTLAPKASKTNNGTKKSKNGSSSSSSGKTSKKQSKKTKGTSEVSAYYKKSSMPYPCECDTEEQQQQHHSADDRERDSEDIHGSTRNLCECYQDVVPPNYYFEVDIEYTPYEFVLIQDDATSEDQYGRLGSSVAMNGLVYKLNYVHNDSDDTEQRRSWGDDPIGIYSSICTVTSSAYQDLLCKFELHLSTAAVSSSSSGPKGDEYTYASAIVSTPITKSPMVKDVGVVTGTAFDFGHYTRGMMTTIQEGENKSVFYVSLSLA